MGKKEGTRRREEKEVHCCSGVVRCSEMWSVENKRTILQQNRNLGYWFLEHELVLWVYVMEVMTVTL